jgi:acyl-CoA thioesterase-1
VRVWLVAALFVLGFGCRRGGEPAPAQQAPPAIPAAEAAKADDRPVIVAFGDSLTAGPGVDADASYPAVLQTELDARGLRYRVVNAGISGDTTGGGLARVDSVIAHKPQIVILELGANDGLRGLPLESTRANLEQIIVALQRAGARVVLAGMTLPPNYGPDYVRGFERIFVELAQKYKASRIPFLLEDVAARPERMLPDALHPNAAGHKIVAANVMKILGPLLQ